MALNLLISPEVTLLTAAFFPLIFALLFIFPPWRNTILTLAPWTALPALLMVLLNWPKVEINLSWLLLESRLGMDETGRVFLGFTSFIWIISGLYGVSYFRQDPLKFRFFIFYLLTLCGNLGLILALDAISFYFFFALMSFSAYGMVVQLGTKEAMFAGKIYIALVVIGEALIFTGLIMAVNAAGSHYFSDIPLKIYESPSRNSILFFLLMGFGIKAGALPLHVWLPLAHTVAPIAASAVLSACMVKAGLLGWLRILPLGKIASIEWGTVGVMAGILATFYSTFVGLTQNRSKTILAYSTISHMGIMTIAVGAALRSPQLWPEFWGVLMLYVASHAFIKSALFLSVGAKRMNLSSTGLRFLRGALFIIPVLAIIGAPLTVGAASKQLIKHPILGFFGSGWLNLLLTFSSVAATFLMIRFLYFVWPDKADEKIPFNKGVFISWTALVFLVLTAPIILSSGGFLGDYSFFPIDWKSFLPMSAAAVFAMLFLYFNIRKPFTIPSGDVLVIYLKVLTPAKKWILQAINLFEKQYICFTNFLFRIFNAFWISEWKTLNLVEKRSESWPVFGTIFLLLMVAFFLMQ
jgi:multicomponent Na+:H+ antiporter subunit D